MQAVKTSTDKYIKYNNFFKNREVPSPRGDECNIQGLWGQTSHTKHKWYSVDLQERGEGVCQISPWQSVHPAGGVCGCRPTMRVGGSHLPVGSQIQKLRACLWVTAACA